MSIRRPRVVAAVASVAALAVVAVVVWKAWPQRPVQEGPFIGHDWPQWRHDASRTGASPQELPAELHLHWVRRYLPQLPAWTDPLNQDRMGYDLCYEPVVAGSTMFVPFAGSDKLVALDTRTGQEKWRFYADGPVRLPPTAWSGRVYFVSDDGHLYCVSADDGALHWKFRGGPGELRVLGNERLVSAWPARGGPVVADGTVYFSAGIWPFMGVYVHALDADSGRVVWTQDGCSFDYVDQPHNSPAFAGPAPQGPLTVVGDRLLVPTGRGVPACLDRATGELLYYRPASSKLAGGAHVAAHGEWYFNARRTRTRMFDLSGGEELRIDLGVWPVLTDTAFYFASDEVVARDPNGLTRTGSGRAPVRHSLASLWRSSADGRGAMIKAGNRLYAAAGGTITAIDLSEAGPPRGEPRTVATVEGTIGQLLAADTRLFAITTDGAIHAFGLPTGAAPTEHPLTEPDERRSSTVTRRAQRILRDTRVEDGYCLVLGPADVRLLEELAWQSGLRIILIDPDRLRVAEVRRRLDESGLYGHRVAALAGDPEHFALPPYLASLTIVEDLGPAGQDEQRLERFVEKVYHSTRPYGGLVRIALPPPQARMLDAIVRSSSLPGAELDLDGGVAMLSRRGPLPGAGTWTHQYGDPANSVRSGERLARAPLGLLWFGSADNAIVLPRHGNGPPPQVIGGRLFVQGIDSISARDVYTGRTLWTTPIPDLGTFGIFYDETHDPDPLVVGYNQVHMPGANARGTNYVATADAVYVLTERGCLKLDAAAGHVLARFDLPATPERPDQPGEWSFLAIEGDLMIAGAEPMVLPEDIRENIDLGSQITPRVAMNLSFDRSASRRIVVRDLRDGRVLWSVQAGQGFAHNAIAIGGGRLYCIDLLSPMVRDALHRRGQSVQGEPALLAFDLRTGELLWRRTDTVFGSWLGYSAEHDLLLQGGRPSRNMLLSEVSDRMACHGAADGSTVWDATDLDYRGPLILHGETIISQGAAFELFTGRAKTRIHPLTGESAPWGFRRNYGCGTAIASEHLLLFRSAAAGFYDLCTDGGTGNLGGFRSGCTSNLIPADGILNAPDYTRTCTCSYQNQASLGLIHMPELETWTFSGLPRPVGRVLRVGLNLGAPGDRQAEDGTLWLDTPSVGGPSPDLPVVFEPTRPRTFRRHSSNVRNGQGHPWVVASGLEGVRSLTVTLYVDPPDTTPWWLADTQPDQPPTVQPAGYTVRLFFAEMRDAAPGERVFDVWVQERKVLEGFDPVAEPGGPWSGVVRQFDDVQVERDLTIRLAPAASAPNCEPILSGVEIILRPSR